LIYFHQQKIYLSSTEKNWEKEQPESKNCLTPAHLTAFGAVRGGHLAEEAFYAILSCSNRRQVSQSVGLLLANKVMRKVL
jgi:hypothetical protein